MRRVLVTVAAVAALTTVGVAIGLVLEARNGERDTAVGRPRASLSVVSASIRPSVHLFGDPVTAELVVVADKALVDPGTVRVRPDFSPYTPTGPRRVERSETAAGARFRFTFTIRCLEEDCAPDSSHRVIDLPGTAVFYRFRSASGPGTAIVDWPSVAVAARVPTEALSPERWRAGVTSMPAVTYTRSPARTSIGLLVASIALALLGVALVWWYSRAAAEVETPAGESEAIRASALERALQLAREASLDGDSPERRKAFERVARELTVSGLPDLTERARALAWAPGAASVVVIDSLEREALAETNGGPP